jgi:hypothetical protein
VLHRYAIACGSVVLALGLVAAAPQQGGDKGKGADKAADSPIVAKTRMKLDTPVSVEYKDEALKDVVKDLGSKSEISFRLDLTGGVSGNTQITYSAKDKPLREVLDEMFKGRGLGYVIHRKQNNADRYEGYVFIVQGDQRGDATPAAGKEPPAKGDTAKAGKPGASKPPAKSDKGDKSDKSDSGGSGGGSGGGTSADPERAATAKLRFAKVMADDGQYKEAREYLNEVITKYPDTKAAGEAKQLLEKWKGKG